MKKHLVNIKKQIEIIGMAILNPEKYKADDFYDFSKISNSTIDRLMERLRKEDKIDIHSKTKRGVYLKTPLTEIQQKELILQYFGIINSRTQFDRATNLLIERHKEKALAFLVALQIAIENNRIIRIKYNKEGNSITERRIYPIQIFQRAGYYRLLGSEENQIKQFHLTKINSIEILDAKFNRFDLNQFKKYFENSLDAWTSEDKFPVKLHFNKEWASYLIPTVLIENQKIIKQTDGSVMVELTVNRLEELAYWIVPRGEGIYVQEPKELRNMVIQYAEATVKYYKNFKS